MAYIAAILARAGHEVKWTRGELVRRATSRSCCRRSSTHKNETAWADRMRAARRQGRLHRHHRVEDAGAVRRITATSSSTASRKRRVMRLAQGDRSRRASSSASRSTISIRCRFRAGIWSPRTASTVGHSSGRRVRSAAAIRCSRAAAARSSAPTARTGSSPATARARSRTSSTRSSGCATRYPRPYVIFRDPLFSEQRDRVPRAVRRDQARAA